MKNKKKRLKILAHPAFQKQMGLEPSEKCRPLEECMDEIDIWRNKWYNKYLWLPFNWWFLEPIGQIPNQIKWFCQRRVRGFDDRELWGLDTSLKEWLAPRLERFIKTRELGHPSNLTERKLVNVLKKILWFARDSEKEDWKLLYGKNNKKDRFNSSTI